jgi:2-polyprenyl-3-methyl-5-hydroxy-6-metoxy-1,4-benzoquinol methylase
MPRVIENDVKNRMRPELELVLLSARAKTFENDRQINELFDAGVNWSEMLACAIQHKLIPVLYERVRDLNPPGLSQDQRDTLTELARNTARSNMAFMNEMLGLYDRFEAAQIPAIPFKGPALAWLAYPSFAHRSCADLDFVVPQRFIPESISLLQSQGYLPHFSPIEAQAGRHGPAPGQYAFAPTGNRSFVELHTERTLRYFSRPIDLTELNSRMITLEIGGKNVRTFSVEDLLVMLCVHGAKHFWERLGWIVDIAQLVTTCEVDWPLLLEIAAKRQSARVLLLGLYLAHEVIGAPLPQSVRDRALNNSHVKYIFSKIIEQYDGNSNSIVGVWPRAVFRLRSCDGYWQGLRQLSRLSMSPTESDRQTISLPGFLSPLYTLVRPFRLLGQYGLGLNRQGKPDLAIYQPTPQEIVELMLHLAKLSPGDVLYDLGCGDGRIVVTAAEKYGVRAVGVDINPTRIAEARANARRHGVEKRVQFILGDAKKADFAEATVIAIYLGPDGNLRLADRLRAHPRAGTRIVSRDFQIYGWEPERIENRTMANGVETSLYLWTIKNSEWESPGTAHASPGAAAAG